jgi:hypothetical protein
MNYLAQRATDVRKNIIPIIGAVGSARLNPTSAVDAERWAFRNQPYLTVMRLH